MIQQQALRARRIVTAQTCDANAAKRSRVFNGNRSDARAFLRSHARDERNAGLRGDHGQNGRKLSAPKDDTRMQARAAASGKRVFTETVILLQQQEGFAFQLSKADGAKTGKGMLNGYGGVELFAKKLGGGEFAAGDGKGEEGGIGRPVA